MKIYDQRKSKFLQQAGMRIALIRHWCDTEIPWQKGSDGNPLRDEEGELLLDFFPRGPTDFAKWEPRLHSEGNRNAIFRWTEEIDEQQVEFEVSLADFEKFSRTNLTQPYHNEIAKEAERQIARIEAKAVAQQERANKVSIIENRDLEIKYLKGVMAEQEKECRDARREASQARIDLATEKQTALNNETQLKRDYQLLEKKYSALLRDFSKVSPIAATKAKK
jgi:exonuclease VII large subunit